MANLFMMELLEFYGRRFPNALFLRQVPLTARDSLRFRVFSPRLGAMTRSLQQLLLRLHAGNDRCQVESLGARMFGKFAIMIAELVKAVLGQTLKVEESVLRPPIGTDELVDLDLKRFGVAVLRVLDEEHHQEGDDSRRRVDGELPHIGIAEKWPGQGPGNDNGG